MAIPVLIYHDLFDDVSTLALRPSVFAWQMSWLHEHGFRVIPLREMVMMLRRAEPLPLRTVVITFDDGFQSVYDVAVPILTQFGFGATVFVVSDYCGGWNDWPSQPAAVSRRRLMTWDQAREITRFGIDFGAHTATHPPLDGLSPSDLRVEIVDAKRRIEERLEHAVSLFAYPYGRLARGVKTLVAETYSGACASRPAMVGPGSDVFQLGRIDVHYVRDPRLFSLLGSPAFPAYVGLRRAGRRIGTSVLRRPWS